MTLLKHTALLTLDQAMLLRPSLPLLSMCIYSRIHKGPSNRSFFHTTHHHQRPARQHLGRWILFCTVQVLSPRPLRTSLLHISRSRTTHITLLNRDRHRLAMERLHPERRICILHHLATTNPAHVPKTTSRARNFETFHLLALCLTSAHQIWKERNASHTTLHITQIPLRRDRIRPHHQR
jgi:hypothetical protein